MLKIIQKFLINLKYPFKDCFSPEEMGEGLEIECSNCGKNFTYELNDYPVRCPKCDTLN